MSHFRSSLSRWISCTGRCNVIVYALEKFREYLEGHEFVLQTDNKALIYLDSMRNSNQRLMRWSWKLQEWSPYIQYVKGRDNVVADFLSRNPCVDDACVDREPEYMFPPGYTTKVSQTRNRLNLRLTCQIDRNRLVAAQCEAGDAFVAEHSSDDVIKLNDVLYKVVGSKLLPIIPESLVPEVISAFHDSLVAGHGGVERTMTKVSRSAYFKQMKSRIVDYVKTCPVCQRVKPDNRKPPGLMQSSPIGSPWEILYMDMMGPYVKSHPGAYTFVLVVIDDFTKWVEIFPLRDATAARIGKVLEESLFCRFGMPKTLVSDNGTNFTSNIMKYLCNQWNIEQRFTSPYHPQSNLTERANRTIKTMIRAYLDGLPHSKWAQNLSFISLAINNSKQESTGFSPANLMLNRDFNLPFDITVSPVTSSANSLNIQVKSNAEIIFDRTQVYSNILAFVRDNLQKAKAKQKEAYDRAHRDDRFEVGDTVLLRDTTLSSAADGVVAGLMPLYRPDVAKVTKVTGELTYEITFDDGTVKPSVHIQNIRRYHERLDSPSGSTNNVSSDNRSNQIPDSVSALDNSNSELDDTVSEIPQDTTALLQNPTPAGLDSVVSASSSRLDTGTIVSDQLSVNSQPVRRSTRLQNKSKIDYLAAHTGRKPRSYLSRIA
jgi:transposase InsO family protein